MPTLTQLQYLVAVDEHRHFGKAAKACHVTQPTLSMQLIKLEEELGFTLFDREKHPVLPTTGAHEIIKQARLILVDVKKLDFMCKNREKIPEGNLVLGIIPTISPYLLPLFLGPFSKKYPRVELTIHEMTTQQIILALENDSIDAALLATPLGVPSFVEEPLYYEPFYVVTHQDSDLAKKEKIKPSDVKAEEIWLLSEGHCFRNQVLALCSTKQKKGVLPNVRFESGNLETLISLVSQGYGSTLLPYLALKKLSSYRNILIRSFVSPVPVREVSLVTRRTQYKQSLTEVVQEQIEKSLPSQLSPQKNKGEKTIGI